MKYRLRYQQQDLELSEGLFLIGRGGECQLSLDDPLVSRMHARLTVEPKRVLVEDLGSRNGVKVNGERISGVRALAHGDKITIGSQEMTVLYKRDAKTDTIVQRATGRGAPGFAVLVQLAEKALALGHGEEAERILAPTLRHLLSDAKGNKKPGGNVVEKAAEYAVKLACATGKGSWVDYVFELYTALERPCPATVVDALYEALRKVNEIDRGVLQSYTELLRASAGSLNPTERFVLSRLEGLERLAAIT